MAQISSIQWTDATWNIARGCTKVDEDCKYCYMYRESLDSTRYNPLQVVKTKTVFDMPLRYKNTISACWDGRPLIFTCSLTDFFHESIDGYRHEAWDIIRKCPHLIFQILTKRPERITEHLPADWGEGWDNVWLGTSCGSQNSDKRICELINVKAKTKFLSLEPLHGSIDLLYPETIWPNGPERCCNGHECGCYGQPVEPWLVYGINWVIVGGESGNDTGKYKYRPCELGWIERIVSDCQHANIPVFVKQMGTHLSKQLKMSDRHGGNIDEFPAHLQVRQFPVKIKAKENE
jgi:protein gp37